MGHAIRAVIARPEVLALVRCRCGEPPLVPLEQGFALLFATDEVLDAIAASDGAGAQGGWAQGFSHLSDALARLLAKVSAEGPVAYVETEYFGGAGTQAAVAYVGGTVAVLCGASERPGPVNEALRAIGVARGRAFDEFAAVGLQKHRHMDA